MLAPKDIPQEFIIWNQQHKAPFGAIWWRKFINSKIRGSNFCWRNRFLFPHWLIRQIGAFGFQNNSQSRIFEYPWCFLATPLEPGMNVIEIGAGASGFQFALAEYGLNVTSVDPLINPSQKVNWTFSQTQFNKLNKSWGNKVKFIQDFLQNTQLESNKYDRIFSISTIEHIPPKEIPLLLKEIERILKPGGFFVTTIDLFLDCHPFTEKISNRYGSNISIRSLVEESGLKMKLGNPLELYGYPEFNSQNIRENIDKFFVHKGVLIQCCILEKI